MAVLRLGELYNDPSKLESTLHPSLISRVRTFSPFFATRAATLSLSLSLFYSLLSPGEHSAANVKLFVIVGGVRSFLLSFHVVDSMERGKVVFWKAAPTPCSSIGALVCLIVSRRLVKIRVVAEE